MAGGIEAGEQARMRRQRDGCRGERPGESNSAGGECVHRRGARGSPAVRAHAVGPQRVDGDEDDGANRVQCRWTRGGPFALRGPEQSGERERRGGERERRGGSASAAPERRRRVTANTTLSYTPPLPRT